MAAADMKEKKLTAMDILILETETAQNGNGEAAQESHAALTPDYAAMVAVLDSPSSPPQKKPFGRHFSEGFMTQPGPSVVRQSHSASPPPPSRLGHSHHYSLGKRTTPFHPPVAAGPSHDSCPPLRRSSGNDGSDENGHQLWQHNSDFHQGGVPTARRISSFEFTYAGMELSTPVGESQTTFFPMGATMDLGSMQRTMSMSSVSSGFGEQRRGSENAGPQLAGSRQHPTMQPGREPELQRRASLLQTAQMVYGLPQSGSGSGAGTEDWMKSLTEQFQDMPSPSGTPQRRPSRMQNALRTSSAPQLLNLRLDYGPAGPAAAVATRRPSAEHPALRRTHSGRHDSDHILQQLAAANSVLLTRGQPGIKTEMIEDQWIEPAFTPQFDYQQEATRQAALQRQALPPAQTTTNHHEQMLLAHQQQWQYHQMQLLQQQQQQQIARGRYRCGKCGQYKVKHECPFKHKGPLRSVGMQAEFVTRAVRDDGLPMVMPPPPPGGMPLTKTAAGAILRQIGGDRLLSVSTKRHEFGRSGSPPCSPESIKDSGPGRAVSARAYRSVINHDVPPEGEGLDRSFDRPYPGPQMAGDPQYGRASTSFTRMMYGVDQHPALLPQISPPMSPPTNQVYNDFDDLEDNFIIGLTTDAQLDAALLAEV